MFLAGYTPDRAAPEGAWKTLGTTIVRYDNWSKEPKKIWEIPTIFEWKNAVNKRVTPASMSHAGELFFVIDGITAVISVHNKATGDKIATVSPGPEVGGFSGWIDIPYGMNSMQRKDGEYLIIAEEDGRAKNMLYRFRNPPSAATAPSSSAIALAAQTEEPEHGGLPKAQTPSARPPQLIRVSLNSPADEKLVFEEDFESGSTEIPKVRVVDMPSPALVHGGEKVGVLEKIHQLRPILGRRPIPPGSQHVVIRYDRLFLEAVPPEVRHHFTRQYVIFNSSPEERHGESQRFYFSNSKVGVWDEIRIEIPIPEEAQDILNIEIANLTGEGSEGYSNPVFIDNLSIYFE